MKSSRAEIMGAIRLAEWRGIDETTIIINGKRGYVWMVRTDKATYAVVTPSRSGQVIPTFFVELIGKNAKVDGYATYKRYFGISRCWSHELLHAEGLAINGGVGSLHDQLYDKMRHTYHTAPVMSVKGGVTWKQCDQPTEMTMEVIAMYGDRKFADRLTGALPCLFNALLTVGMHLTTNVTESDIRKVVRYRNAHHNFKIVRSMSAFAVLFSLAETAKKNGMRPAEAIIHKVDDPNWSLFDGDGGGSTPDVTGSETIQPETVQETVQPAESETAPDVTGSETIQPETVQETAQPAEPKCSPDDAGHPPETDMKNQTVCGALSSTIKLVLCAYVTVLLLECHPCMCAECNGQYPAYVRILSYRASTNRLALIYSHPYAMSSIG